MSVREGQQQRVEVHEGLLSENLPPAESSGSGDPRGVSTSWSKGC